MGGDGMSDLVKRLRIKALETGDYLHHESADRIEQLERELECERKNSSNSFSKYIEAAQIAAAEKALSDDLDGGLGVAQDIIEAASKQLTKKAGTKWGLWYLDRITELRAVYRKARGL